MSTASFAAKRVRRAVPSLLRENAVFRSYWGAHTVSLFGDQVSLLALPLVAVLALDAGAAQMGYLTAIERGAVRRIDGSGFEYRMSSVNSVTVFPSTSATSDEMIWMFSRNGESSSCFM